MYKLKITNALAFSIFILFLPSYAYTLTEGDTGFFYNDAVECHADTAKVVEKKDIYIAVDGDDTNSGETPDSPLATIAEALCNASPGQTIHLSSGTYYQSVIIDKLGLKGNEISITGPLSGEPAILDGKNKLTFGLAFISSQQINIQNLHFKNFTDQGLLVALSEDILIDQNVFEDNGRQSVDPESGGEGFGVNVVDVKNVSITNNISINNGPTEELVASGILGTGINTYGLINGIIANNTISQTRGGGILVEDGISVTVENNIIENNALNAGGNYWDAGIWIDGSYRVYAKNNTISNNTGPAIQISDSDRKYPFTSCEVKIENNQINNNYWGAYIHSYGQCRGISEKIARFNNNHYSQNSYNNMNEEEQTAYFSDLEGGMLCYEWPCGENSSCTTDNFDKTTRMCESNSVFSYKSERLYLNNVGLRQDSTSPIESYYDAELALDSNQNFNLVYLFQNTDTTEQTNNFYNMNNYLLEISEIGVQAGDNSTISGATLIFHPQDNNFSIDNINN